MNESNVGGSTLSSNGNTPMGLYSPKSREKPFEVIDPGHHYKVKTFEGKQADIVFISKRLAEGQPPGTLETVHDGLTNEALIAVLISRMHYLQAINPCNENEEVIGALKVAQNAIEHRARDRQIRGVQGSSKA